MASASSGRQRLAGLDSQIGIRLRAASSTSRAQGQTQHYWTMTPPPPPTSPFPALQDSIQGCSTDKCPYPMQWDKLPQKTTRRLTSLKSRMTDYLQYTQLQVLLTLTLLPAQLLSPIRYCLFILIVLLPRPPAPPPPPAMKHPHNITL